MFFFWLQNLPKIRFETQASKTVTVKMVIRSLKESHEYKDNNDK